MASFSVLRANDPVIATAKIAEIVPKNWHRFPPAVGATAVANGNAAKPRYNTADYTGVAYGDDVTQSKANLAVDRSDGGPDEPDYAPRTQAAKATALGTVLAQDITRPRGWIAPGQPYTAPPASPAGDPTLTSLSPATAVAGAATPQFAIKLIGTNFTPYSQVWMAGVPAPTNIFTYISPTEMRVQMSPKASVPGTATLAVMDHGIFTVNRTFTWT
jgi:hypothetical protein